MTFLLISATFLDLFSGVYGSKQDIYDFEKHVDEISLNELLDGSYKCPKSIKENEKKTEILHKSILVSIRAASSILQLQKPKQPQNVAPVDGTNTHNASSSLPNPAASGTSTNNDSKGDADPSSCNKVSFIYTHQHFFSFLTRLYSTRRR